MIKILSIDDRQDNQIAIRGALSSNIIGAEFIFALSGEEGIRLARINKPDVILLDIMMPGMDGFETCFRLKSDPELRGIPVILLSAIGNKTESRIRGLEIGADAVMAKPFDPDELAAQIRVMFRIKQAEDKLRQENTKLDRLVNDKIAESVYQATVLENVSDAVVSTDSDFVIKSWNEAAELTYGWNEAESLGRKYDDVLNPQYFGMTRGQVAEQFLMKGKYSGEVIHEHKDGSKRIIMTSVSKLIDKHEKNIGAVALNRDITKEKKMESDLVWSEERYRTMVENSNDLMWIIDTKGCFTFYNKHVEDATGYDFQQFIGEHFEQIIPESKRKWMKRELNLVLSGKNRQIETGVYFAGGIEHILWISMAPVFKDAEVEAVVCFARDVTDYRQAMEELKLALDKAKESDNLKSAFLSTMSHELRTPLNAIIGFSSLMNNEMELDEVGKFALIINESGQHLLSLVEEIFDITLIEAGQVYINNERFELIPFMNAIHELILTESTYLKRDQLNIIFKPELALGQVSIFSDKRRLQQILINLLKNALKFTEKGTIEYGIEEVTERGLPFLRFYVSDTGIGIAEDKRNLIFEVFRQVDDTHTRVYEGIGIGLSAAKKLTELLGGTIGLTSEEGIGSTFAFTIPFQTKKLAESESSAGKNQISFQKRKVLVVEDDIDSYHLLELLLLKYDVVSVWATNGLEAVEYCSGNELPWLVLMDLNMPVMTGFEATRILKQRYPSLPIIVQTAYITSNEVEQAQEAGCDDFISKPISKIRLIEVMSKFV